MATVATGEGWSCPFRTSRICPASSVTSISPSERKRTPQGTSKPVATSSARTATSPWGPKPSSTKIQSRFTVTSALELFGAAEVEIFPLRVLSRSGDGLVQEASPIKTIAISSLSPLAKVL